MTGPARYPMFAGYDGAGTLDELSTMSLLENGYAIWDDDFSTTTDAQYAPASPSAFDCNADCHIKVTFTCENTKFVFVAFRYTDATNYVRLEIDASRVPTLKKNVAGTPTTLWTGGALTDAVAYQFNIVAEGTSIKVNQDNVLMTTQTVADHATVTGGVVSDDFASNDIYVLAYLNPALGIATDRVIAPQSNDTGTMTADAIVYNRTYGLPSAGGSQSGYRYVNDQNRIVLNIDSAGKPSVYHYILGVFSAKASGSNGDVIEGADVAIVLDGVNVEVFANGASVCSAGTLTHVTGTGIDMLHVGNNASMDAVELWPRDVTALLPSELV